MKMSDSTPTPLHQQPEIHTCTKIRHASVPYTDNNGAKVNVEHMNISVTHFNASHSNWIENMHSLSISYTLIPGLR